MRRLSLQNKSSKTAWNADKEKETDWKTRYTTSKENNGTQEDKFENKIINNENSHYCDSIKT